jgi:hypothetical protein
MIERTFFGMERFTHFLERLAVTTEIPMEIAAAESARVLQHNIKKVYGDNTKLAHLAPFTQEERVSLGYTPDDPLLRTGELLRDNVERFSAPGVAAAGSPEVINAYHEVGYTHNWTGNRVPPRPVFKIGLQDSELEVIEIVEAACGAILGFGPVAATVTREGD